MPTADQIVVIAIQIIAMAAFIGSVLVGYRWLASGRPSKTPLACPR